MSVTVLYLGAGVLGGVLFRDTVYKHAGARTWQCAECGRITESIAGYLSLCGRISLAV